MEWLVLVAIVALGVSAAPWLAQERLIFFPQPIASTAHLPARAASLEVVAADRTRLRGWIVATSLGTSTIGFISFLAARTQSATCLAPAAGIPAGATDRSPENPVASTVDVDVEHGTAPAEAEHAGGRLLPLGDQRIIDVARTRSGWPRTDALPILFER